MTVRNIKAATELLGLLGKAIMRISRAMGSDHDRTADFHLAVSEMLEQIDALDRKYVEKI